MDSQNYQFSNLFTRELIQKTEWKFVHLSQRPLPPIEVKESFSFHCLQMVGMSLIAGYVMGGFLSFFFMMLDNKTYDTQLSLRAQGRAYISEASGKFHRQGKAFGIFGALLFSYECPLESYRGSHDSLNAFISGAFVGSLTAFLRKQKFLRILRSAAGTGLFIGVIDLFLNH